MSGAEWTQDLNSDDLSTLAARVIEGAFRDLVYSETALRSLRRISSSRHGAESLRRPRLAETDTREDIEFFESGASDMFFAVLDLNEKEIETIKHRFIHKARPTVKALDNANDLLQPRRRIKIGAECHISATIPPMNPQPGNVDGYEQCRSRRVPT